MVTLMQPSERDLNRVREILGLTSIFSEPPAAFLIEQARRYARTEVSKDCDAWEVSKRIAHVCDSQAAACWAIVDLIASEQISYSFERCRGRNSKAVIRRFKYSEKGRKEAEYVHVPAGPHRLRLNPIFPPSSSVFSSAEIAVADSPQPRRRRPRTATTRKPQELTQDFGNGPRPSLTESPKHGFFHWEGVKPVALQGVLWRLAHCLWGHERIEVRDVKVMVWKRNAPKEIKPALTRLKQSLRKGGIPVSWKIDDKAVIRLPLGQAQ